MCLAIDAAYQAPSRVFNHIRVGPGLAFPMGVPQHKVSPSAGWDAMPGRLDGWGLPEGQSLSLRRFRALHLLFGVCLPVVSIAAESLTGWSARAYANPIPNGWFLALALSAPAANFAAWVRLCTAAPPGWLERNDGAIAAANRWALAASLGYSLLYLPILPAALILSILAVGLLPLAPFFSLYTAWSIRRAIRAERLTSLIRFESGGQGLTTARNLLCQINE